VNKTSQPDRAAYSFIGYVNDQLTTSIAASESLNGRRADCGGRNRRRQALRTIPDRCGLRTRQQPRQASDQLGKSAHHCHTVHQTKDALVQEFKALGAFWKSLANAGPALTAH